MEIMRKKILNYLKEQEYLHHVVSLISFKRMTEWRNYYSGIYLIFILSEGKSLHKRLLFELLIVFPQQIMTFLVNITISIIHYIAVRMGEDIHDSDLSLPWCVFMYA